MIVFENNQRFIVTGASSGIGKATVLHLLKAGACVVGIARNKAALEEIKQDFLDTFFYVERDLSVDVEGLPQLVDDLAEKYGQFSGFVHCAGVLNPQPLVVWNYQDALKDFNVNLFSAVEIMKGLLKKRNRQKNLNIVLVSSVASRCGNAGSISYAMTKAALNNLVVSLTQEVGRYDIRINAVCPGWIETGLVQFYKETVGIDYLEESRKKTAFHETGKVWYVSDVIKFLLSPQSHWIQGQCITVDGAETCGA